MNHRLLLAAVLSLGWASAGASQPVRDEKPDAKPPASSLMSNDQAILFWQERVQRDAQDLVSQTMLAYTYIRKAREVGDFASYDKAEAVLQTTLKADKDYFPARANLALIYSARHRFTEALELAKELYAKHPEEAQLLILTGDAHLELGHYGEAEKAYRDYLRLAAPETLPTRLSRLAELKGDTREAIRLMEAAAEEERQARVTQEGGVWYQVRLGEMHLSAGRLAEAATHYEAALKQYAGSYVALAGLGRVRAAQGKTGEAIDLYKKAAAISPDPLVVIPLGDLYLQTDQPFLAEVAHRQFEKAARGQSAYDRDLALYYADHDKNLPEAVELATKDLKVRQDIYAYDTLGWALCKNQRYEEAAKAMTEALKLGTQDASLFYHAGLVYRGLGDKAKARDYLQKALALNPHFSISQAERARKALAALAD
jgi:tetratricopeptide (TPR) repeat protein